MCSAASLRRLANEFSNSPLRQELRARAQTVNLATLTSTNFSEMIQQVFQVAIID